MRQCLSILILAFVLLFVLLQNGLLVHGQGTGNSTDLFALELYNGELSFVIDLGSRVARVCFTIFDIGSNTCFKRLLQNMANKLFHPSFQTKISGKILKKAFSYSQVKRIFGN